MKTVLRDRKHLDWLRELPCVKCGMKESVGAHIRKYGDGGTGMKPSDDRAIPLCGVCHDFQHRCGELTFYKDVWKAIYLAKGLYLFSGDMFNSINLIGKYRGELF